MSNYEEDKDIKVLKKCIESDRRVANKKESMREIERKSRRVKQKQSNRQERKATHY